MKRNVYYIKNFTIGEDFKLKDLFKLTDSNINNNSDLIEFINNDFDNIKILHDDFYHSKWEYYLTNANITSAELEDLTELAMAVQNGVSPYLIKKSYDYAKEFTSGSITENNTCVLRFKDKIYELYLDEYSL